MSCKVSVIIPVYNCIKYLDSAVKSVINQTDFDLTELILVDDGSFDGSEKICDSYARKYENITVIHHENAGVSVARNLGIAAAEGEYIAFLDSDDSYDPFFIHEMLGAADSDLVCCDYFIPSDKKVYLGNLFKNRNYSGNEFDLDFYSKIISEEFYPCWNKLFKRNIILENNIGFKPGVKYAEDMIFVFEYLKFCKSFRFVDRSLYCYNVNPGNTTSVVKNGFDVQLSIYSFQKDYFKSTPYESEMNKKISKKFVYKTACSINSEITYESFAVAYKYVKRVLSSFFYDLYMEENYTEYKCLYDKVFFTLLKKRMAFAVVLWRKIFDLRSRFFNDRSN